MASSPSAPPSTCWCSTPRYHRDQRNIATHFVGVPMIVFGVGVLLARGQFALGGPGAEPAWLACALARAVVPEPRRPALGLAASAAIGVLSRWRIRWPAAAPAPGWPGAGLLRRRLGHPVRRPLLRGQASRPSPTTWSACWSAPMFVTAEAAVRAGLVSRCSPNRAPRRPHLAARPGAPGGVTSTCAPRPKIEGPVSAHSRRSMRAVEAHAVRQRRWPTPFSQILIHSVGHPAVGQIPWSAKAAERSGVRRPCSCRRSALRVPAKPARGWPAE